MTTLAVILTILATLVGLEWLARNLLALRVWRSLEHLQPDSLQPTDTPLPPMSVVVAAKDEEGNIADCVASLLGQDYPDLQIVLVNDRSGDRTGEIIAQLADEHENVTALTIETLPADWCGKNHAMQQGLAAAKHDWLCMIDADCRLVSPKTLAVAMRYSLRHEVDLLSLLPTMLMGGFWEYFLQPICIGVMMIWFPPKRVNNPNTKTAYANGMFMLISREAYRAIGTHEAIKGSLIEDMDMARMIKQQGRTLRTMPTRDLITVRMYTSLSGFIRGWVRIFLGSFRTLPRLLGALGVLLGRGMTLTVLTGLGWIMVAVGAGPTAWWPVCAAIATGGLVAQLVMTARYYRFAESRWWMGLLYPLGCSMVAALLVKTMFKHRPGATLTWRDTDYSARSA